MCGGILSARRADMDNFHVSPSGDRWKLSAEGSPRSIGEFDTKDEAVDMATTVIAERTGSLKIHKSDGTIEEERTYPRSADPRKSPG
jgi:hypothetical protein